MGSGWEKWAEGDIDGVFERGDNGFGNDRQ